MTTQEIETKFPDELDAIKYFEQLRWGDSVRCSYCNTGKVSKRQADHRFHCSQCRKTFSVTTGTHLHSSKLPLKIWMHAFSISNQNGNRIPIKTLQGELKVSYTTAWRIRQGIKEIISQSESMPTGENMFDFMCSKAIAEQEKPVLQPELQES